jgi:MoxR-like ATPase
VAALGALRAEVARRVVGQDAVVEELLLAIVAGGHARLVGVPGLAKTLLVKSLAESMRLDFRRIQFTPDLVPSDITGSEVMEEAPAPGTARSASSRAGVRQRGAGRRDQPRPAAHAGRRCSRRCRSTR